MIEVCAVYIGNGSESFIESNFKSGVNVISSLDNNVGKTIVMQAIMYTFGALPTFPKGFPYREYIYIVDLRCDGRLVSIMRSKNTFAVLDGVDVITCESVFDLQEWWTSTITPLPIIIKDGKTTVCGLELYTQMSFISQDKRTSAKVNAGRFNKNDFIEMLYAIKKLDARTLTTRQVDELKAERKALKQERASLMKQTDAIRSGLPALVAVSPTADRGEMEALVERLNSAKNDVVELRNRRNRLLSRLTKNEIVLRELNSLKIDAKAGEIVCLNCGSAHIGYRMAASDFTFDITTPEMRNQILASVQQRIDLYKSELMQLEEGLRLAQTRLENLLIEKPITLEDVVACQDEYAEERDLDAEITRVDDRIACIDESLKSNAQVEGSLKTQRKEFMDSVLDTMNSVHRQISVDESPGQYEGIFTTDANVYSGSESTEYFISRVYALAQQVKHGMPVLIDSFRAEDLSSMREERVLSLLGQLGNQVILTTTLKKEEGVSKYAGKPSLHSIDYSLHQTNHLLTPSYNDAFSAKMQEFGVVFS